MGQRQQLMASGLSALQARCLGQSEAATALTATGSAQGDALVLTKTFNEFATVAASTGALLPSATGQPRNVIYNGGLSALTVYPTGSETINGGSSFSVTNGKSAFFTPSGNKWNANLSS